MSDINVNIDDASQSASNLASQLKTLEAGANTFSRAITQSFAVSITPGRQFDDVLKSLALRMSSIALNVALKPVQTSIASGIDNLLSGLTGTSTAASTVFAAAKGAVKPFASGGVIGTPTYFPLMQGGLGLAGEAGPEAIMPLKRGPDGRLGVAGSGATNNITVQIASPDPGSFRRSESYITGQIARAVARGQRSL
jgi:lambda family phage tail tape measure protein